MDQTRVPRRKDSAEKSQQINRRPVEVKVERYEPKEFPPTTDINNNRARLLIHPVNVPMIPLPTFDLPLVSMCFAVIQVVLYFVKEEIGVTSEEVVHVSWKTIVTHGEVWRLLYAHFFHFGKVHIFFNVVTLMGIGRFLEKKIQAPAFAILIIIMSAISNLLYIGLSDILCPALPQNEATVGFSTAMFSLRMVHIFTMDSDANNGKGDPNLIFGFFPVHLPAWISPWQPVLETIFFDIFIIGRCVAATVSGMCAGLIFPFLMKHFRMYIMLPRNPPPPPPKYRSRLTMRGQDDNNNSEDDTTSDSDDDDFNGNSHYHHD